MDPAVVVQMEDRTIPVHRLREELQRNPGASRDEVLGEMIRFQATLLAAERAGLRKSPEFEAEMERWLVARYEALQSAGAENPAVTEDEVKARYAAEETRYRKPAALRCGALFLSISAKATPEVRAARRSEAEALLAQARQTNEEGFARLVARRSEDQATRYRSGDLGWIATEPAVDEPSDPLVVAVRALAKPGDFAPVVETPTGFHVVRLLETRPASVRPYGSVAAELRHRIQQEKRERSLSAYQARLTEGLEIRTNRTLLETFPVAQGPEQPTSPKL